MGICEELKTMLRLKQNGKEVLSPQNLRTFHDLVPRSMYSAELKD